MSSKFTVTSNFSSNERDWQAEMGMLPWTTSIVFTKESLVNFLKTVDVEVDPNMSQLKKLPKFARCGIFSSDDDVIAPTSTEPKVVTNQSSDVPAFIPTRKVREQPGGGSSQIASLLSGGWEEENKTTSISNASPIHKQENLGKSIQVNDRDESPTPRVMNPDGSIFIPTRKVREPVGGHSSMASILAGDK